MSQRKALITGVTGQDGAYLSEFLLSKGYEVHGLRRRSSSFNTARIDHLYHDTHEDGKNFHLHHGDMTDSLSLTNILEQVKPDEIYNLAAQSHVKLSFEQPEYTANVDALGALRLLESIRLLGLQKLVDFIRQVPLSCLEKCSAFLRMKPQLSTLAALMPLQNCMLIGLQSTTEKRMAFTPVTEFYLIMKVLYGGRLL